MILWHIDKRWEALAEPHCNISVHVDSERLKALLETTHGVKLEGTSICPKIHAANLRQPQGADRHKSCRTGRDSSDSAHRYPSQDHGSQTLTSLRALSLHREKRTHLLSLFLAHKINKRRLSLSWYTGKDFGSKWLGFCPSGLKSRTLGICTHWNSGLM